MTDTNDTTDPFAGLSPLESELALRLRRRNSSDVGDDACAAAARVAAATGAFRLGPAGTLTGDVGKATAAGYGALLSPSDADARAEQGQWERYYRAALGEAAPARVEGEDLDAYFDRVFSSRGGMQSWL